MAQHSHDHHAGLPLADMSSDNRTPAVTITGLVKRYGSTIAINGMDLTMARGDITALLGPNGAGKSTLVDICAGFSSPDAGTISVLDCHPIADAQRLRPRLGVMPQGGGAYPSIRADEMLQLVSACAAHPLDTAWLLDILGLTKHRKTPYKRLSGGQQQRLALACAIIGRPELVFLDEPTAGVDPQARHVVWDLITALRRDGVTVVLTTHLLDEAEQLADQIIIVDQGKIIAQGTPAELTSHENTCQSLTFHSQPGLDVELLTAALPIDCLAYEVAAGRYEIRGPINPQVLATVTTWCAQHGALAHEITVAKRSLEDIFLTLTGAEIRS